MGKWTEKAKKAQAKRMKRLWNEQGDSLRNKISKTIRRKKLKKKKQYARPVEVVKIYTSKLGDSILIYNNEIYFRKALEASGYKLKLTHEK